VPAGARAFSVPLQRLIDEYEFAVQPILAGHGPTLFAGLSEQLELKLVGRHELRSGAVALRYQPSRVMA
jgi:dihydrofolate reductase